MKLIGSFLIKLYLVHKLFRHIFTKWPPAAILVFPICSKIDRVLPLQVINGCVNYEFDTCIGVAVT